MRVITSKIVAGPREWVLPPVHRGRYTGRKLRVDVSKVNRNEVPANWKRIGSDPNLASKYMGKRQCVHAGVGFCYRCTYSLIP